MPEFFRITNKAADTLEIDIEGTIGEAYDWWTDTTGTTKEQIFQKLKDVANSAASKIVVNINSFGGDVNDGISIHDALATHKAKVTTRINGFTASAATIIAMAADPGQREISANSLFLVHKASNIAMGNEHDFKTALSDLQKVDGRIADIYAKRCKKPVNEIMDIMDRFDGRGEWLTAQEAKDLGFIDTINEPLKAVAFAGIDSFGKIGLPEIPKDKLQIINQNQEEMKPTIINKTTIKAWFDEFIQGITGKSKKEDIKTDDPPEETKPENVITVKDMDEVSTMLSDLAGAVEEKETVIAGLNTQITDMTTKITTLEDQVAKAKGLPTITKDVEDPSHDAGQPIGNKAAHEANAKALRGE